MIKRQITLILFLVFGAIQIVNAQSNKMVILNLKNGYSVKGEIIEQSAQGVKIRLLDGEIFEYKTDEISSTDEAKLSSSSNKVFSPTKVVPQVIAKGDKIINIGIGLLQQLPGSNSEKMTIPPIPISFEYIIKNDLFKGNGALGVGGFLGYTAAKQDGYYNYKQSRLIIGARGYMHYAIVEKLDTYGGILLGYKSDISKTDYNGNYPDEKFTDSKPTLNIFVGCRYFFNDKIAGMAELGWGVSILSLGVSFKLPNN